MSVEKKVPELRFKGFSGDWENLTLGDLGSVAMNKRIFKHQTSASGDVPFFKIGTFGKQPDAFISSTLFYEYKAKYPYPVAGDLLLSASGSIGRVVEYKGEKQYFQDSNIVWLKHDGRIDNSFLKVFYSMVKWSGLEGSTIKRLYNKNILDTEINTPERPEQTAIGNTFQKLDSLINQYQQKHDQLNNIKKAMLEKMFPKQGETTPEIRFKGFSGEWKEAVLSDFAEKFDNLRVAVTAKDRITGSTPYYGANGIQDYVEGFTHDGEYILLAEDGANDLKNYPIHYVNGKVWVNNHAHVLKAKESFSNIFIKYALNNVDFEPFLVGGGRAKLNASIMMNLVLAITTDVEEQTIIGNYFQKLDTLISQHQNQITKLNNIKQACLSKMFI